MDQDDRFIEFNKGMPTGRQDRFSWMIDALLHSRKEAGLTTGIHRPDEDVNMYLVDLLCRYIGAAGNMVSDQPIIPYESELHEHAAGLPEIRSKYMLYRSNADHLLISIGIFSNAWFRDPHKSAFRWAPTRNETITRGKWYYHQAAIYADRLDDGRRGLNDILFKLEVGFEDYLKILETMRSEYFNFVKKFSDGEWAHFCRDLGIAVTT
ncbi:MAG: hypothetical protein GY835_25940 [bacterium]|nr:hypothetical protein [bacterium]